MSDRIQRAWGTVSHLFSVNSTANWRQAYNACLPKLTEYGVEVSQSEPLFRAYEALAASDEYKGYDRSEEHTSELQSLMRISYAVFCLKKKNLSLSVVHDTTPTTHSHQLSILSNDQ